MKARVTIGLPHVGPLPGYFFDSYAALNKGTVGLLRRVENLPIDMARNAIVETFLSVPEMTHLFFMDADMVFPVEAITRLLSRNVDIVGGCYFSRDDATRPHAYRYVREEEGLRYYQSDWASFATYYKALPADATAVTAAVLPDSPLALTEVDAVATGCLLISRQAIEAVGSPWFSCRAGSPGGEDFDFCEKARAKGFSVWADWSVQCAHALANTFVGREDFAFAAGFGTPDEHTEQILCDTGATENPPPLAGVTGQRGRELAGVD